MEDRWIIAAYLVSVVVYAVYLQRKSSRKRHGSAAMSFADVIIEIPGSLLMAMMWPLAVLLAPVAALLPERGSEESETANRQGGGR